MPSKRLEPCGSKDPRTVLRGLGAGNRVRLPSQSGALVAAVLRPGKRPTGVENAMIMRRVLSLIRHHFPDTHILVRGDGPSADRS